MNNDLPPFEESPYCFAVLKSALRELTKKSGIGLKQIKIHESAGSPVCYPAFNKFVSTQKKKEISKGGNYWDWIAKNYPDVLRAAINEQDDPRIRNHLSRELNNLINQAPYNYNTLERMQGRFLVYRKRFSKPDSIMVMVLNCGINDDKTRFSLTSIFRTSAKGIEQHTGYGNIVPHKESKMVSFYGAVQKWNASFMMSVEPINTFSAEPISEAFGGIMVATPNYSPLTSYAESYIVRTYDDVSPFIVPKSELLSSPKDEHIVRYLKL